MLNTKEMRNDTVVNRAQSPKRFKAGLTTPVNGKHVPDNGKLPEILFINSYPPRECGIATYSQDLVKALNNK